MHGQVVGPVALDQVLRLLLRGVNGVSQLERRADLPSGDSAHATGLGVPAHMVTDLGRAWPGDLSLS